MNIKPRFVVWALVGAVVIAASVVGLDLALFRFFADLDKASAVGQASGFAAAIFSGLAFGGVIVALKMQRDELRLQREELEATREELKRSADAQEQSHQMLAEQVRVMRESAEMSMLTALASCHAQWAQLFESERTRAVTGTFIGDRRKRLDEIIDVLEAKASRLDNNYDNNPADKQRTQADRAAG